MPTEDCRYKDVVYVYRGYCYSVAEPKKNEVTGQAAEFIKEFIFKATEFIKMNDWRLSKRENQVIGLLSDGLTIDETAASLNISINSAKKFLQNVYMKYGISGKNCNTRAVLMYMKNIGRLN